MTQAALQELTQNQLMTSGFPGIDSDRLMTHKSSQFFNSNQLMTQVKIFDSESIHDLALSHTLPISAGCSYLVTG